MNRTLLPPLRRWRWPLAAGSLVLGIVAFVAYRATSVSPVEQEVRRYFVAARNKPQDREELANQLASQLGTNAVPHLFSVAAKMDPGLRQRVRGYARKLSGIPPARTLQAILDTTDAARDSSSAISALSAIALMEHGADALAPYLESASQTVCVFAICALGSAAGRGNPRGFACLTDALQNTSDASRRVMLAGVILDYDRKNATALAALQAAEAGTDSKTALQATFLLKQHRDPKTSDGH